MQIISWKKFCNLLGVVEPQPKKYLGWESQPISDAQKKYLRNLGIGSTDLKTKGQASFLIDLATGRKEKGLATPGQLVTLAAIKVADVKTLTAANAAKKLKAAGYVSRCPEYVLAARACG